MMAVQPTILLTRPQEASERFAAELRAQASVDLRTVISPLLGIVLRPIPPETVSGATPVFTSMNGCRSWQANRLPASGLAFCTGRATAEAARALGFEAISADGTVADLLPVIMAAKDSAPFVHIRGAHTRGDLVQTLQADAVQAHDCVAYDQPLLPLSKTAKDLLNGQNRVIVPLFSPRSAAQFTSECPEGAQPVCVAMSPAVAEHVPKAIVSRTPDAQGMIAAILALL